MMGMRRNRTLEVYRAGWGIKRCATGDRGKGWRDKRARCVPRLWSVISETYMTISRGAHHQRSLQIKSFRSEFNILARCVELLS